MKKSTHLVDVPGTSTNSDPDYFDEHGKPVMLRHIWYMPRQLTRRNI